MKVLVITKNQAQSNLLAMQNRFLIPNSNSMISPIGSVTGEKNGDEFVLKFITLSMLDYATKGEAVDLILNVSGESLTSNQTSGLIPCLRCGTNIIKL